MGAGMRGVCWCRIGHIHRQTAWSIPPDKMYIGLVLWKAYSVNL